VVESLRQRVASINTDRLWSSSTKLVLVGSTATGLLITTLQELYRHHYGLSIKEFDPRLYEDKTVDSEP
jgi:hypothetical protein